MDRQMDKWLQMRQDATDTLPDALTPQEDKLLYSMPRMSTVQKIELWPDNSRDE